jgi:hypothetical protein
MPTGTKGFGSRAKALAATLALAAVMLCSAAPASGDFDFCPPGEGAGQCGLAAFQNSLRGLSIDFETGHLYAADRTNHRVLVFEEDGDFLFGFGWGVADGVTAALQTCGPAASPPTAQCFKGIAGSGPGQFGGPTAEGGPTRVAVDNNPAGLFQHDIYVVDDNRRVQKFSLVGGVTLDWAKGGAVSEGGEEEGKFGSRISLGVGPGGTVYALDNLPTAVSLKFKHRLQRLDPATGNSIPPQCILGERGLGVDMAVAADGSFWVANDGRFSLGGVPVEPPAVRKYSAPPPPGGCAELLVRDEEIAENNALALDEGGRVFIEQREDRDGSGGSFHVIMARDAAGEPLARFGYGRLLPSQPEGLAAHTGGEGGIFYAFGNSFTDAAGIRRLNPVLPPPGPIAAPPSLEVDGVGPTSATVTAEVNPEGETSQVHFEYLTRKAYEDQGEEFVGPGTEATPPQTLVPESGEEFRLKSLEEAIGCPDPAKEVEEPGNECLLPETEYLWRVVAVNPDGAGEGTAEGSPFETTDPLEVRHPVFSTEVGTDTARLGAEVNPHAIPATGYFEYVDDAGFQESGFAEATKVPDVDAGQTPLDFGAGEDFTIRSIAVFPLTPGTIYHYRLIADDPLIDPITSEAEELRTFALPERPPCPNDADRIGPGALLPDCRAYELVSPLDKEGGDIRVLKDEVEQLTVLEQASSTGEKLAYGSSRSFGGALSAPITSQYIAERIEDEEWESHPINVARGRPVISVGEQFPSEFKAFSADLCQAWIATTSEMPDAPPGFEPGFQNLVRRHDRLCGEERLEALAPLGTPETVKASEFFIKVQGTSAEGNHAIFTANDKLAEGGKVDTTQLYESVSGEAPRFVCQLPNGAPFEGACTAGTTSSNGLKPLPGAISADGERIFFSTGGAGARPLYVRIGGTQTVAVSGGAAATFWGAAGDGSVAVFEIEENGSPLDDNLYRFDVDSEAETLIAEGVMGVLGVSEDASRIYFASKDVLAGSGQNSEGDEAIAGELNLYLDEAGVSTSFVATLAGADVGPTVSESKYGARTARVTPDGAHALFASIAPLTAYDNVEAGTACGGTVAGGDPCREIYRYEATSDTLLCVSCNPTGGRAAGPSSLPFLLSPLHAARLISDDGSRVYFESADRLAARDSNGKVDVYQWEETGAGDCEEGSYDFSAAAQGCIELISSGRGLQDSRVVETDVTGKNVFFVTVSSLLPQDYGLFDVYDAREGGGLPIPLPPIPPCEGDECHNPPLTPDPPTPASSTYTPPEAKRARKGCPKGKRRVRGKGGKTRCVPKKNKHQRKRRAQ